MDMNTKSLSMIMAAMVFCVSCDNNTCLRMSKYLEGIKVIDTHEHQRQQGEFHFYRHLSYFRLASIIILIIHRWPMRKDGMQWLRLCTVFIRTALPWGKFLLQNTRM